MAIAQQGRFPGVKLRCSFTGNPLRNPRNSAPVWVDISTRIVTCDWEIGWPNGNLDATPQATIMSVLLSNQDRALDRLNTASVYYPNVTPLRPVTLDWIWGGTTYDAWTGVVDEWRPGITLDGVNTMEMICFDRLGLVAQAVIPASTADEGAGELTSLRIARVLATKLGWNAADAFFSGTAAYGYMAPERWGRTALSHLADIQRVEGGQSYLYMRPDGNVIITGRNDIKTVTRMNTAQISFTSDSSTTARFSAITFRDTREDLRTQAVASRSGSTRSYVYTSTANSDTYFRHSTDLSGVPTRHSGDVEAHASWRVQYLKTPRFRVDQLRGEPLRNGDHAFPKMLATRVGDRATIEWRPKGASAQYSRTHWITGWSGHVDWPGRSFTLDFKFDPADDLYAAGSVNDWGVVGSATSGFRLGV